MKTERNSARRALSSAARVVAALVIFAFLVTACEPALGSSSDGDGILRLSLTDAPLLDEEIDGVWITISGIEYHRNGSWQRAEDFEGPQTYNLLELTDGESALLGELALPAGQYNQIRFLLDIDDEGDDAEEEQNGAGATTPGSYLTFEDGEDERALFVPSGLQTGYKAVGSFTVPENGTVDVTADFDARRAVVKAGASGLYLLKPVIRLVVENQAGKISGVVDADAVDGFDEASPAVVYAYEQGAFDETAETEGDDASEWFANAVTSALVRSSDAADHDIHEFTLAFLAEGAYHLVLVTYDGAGEATVAAELEDVDVQAGETTEGIVIEL